MRNEGLPDREAKPGGAVCHSCGRFVGPATRCRYCGAPVRQRISVRFFRWAAVLLATLGLALLYIMSISREVPRIEIGSISNTMNFAYINVEGLVPQAARVYSSGGIVSSVGFVVDDGTGSIPVRAYGRKGQLLVDSGNLPRAGDRIAMDASLNVSADDRTLYLQVPESLEILEREEIAAIEIGALGKDDVGSLVRISGSVGRVLEPRNDRQPWLIEVKDGTGGIDLTLWQDLHRQMQNRDLLCEGTAIDLTAEISTYRGELRLSLNQAGDIELTEGAAESVGSDSEIGSEPDEDEAALSAISELGAVHVGRLAKVSGKLGKPVSIKGGVFYMLYGSGGRIKMLLWDSRVMGGSRERIRAGSRVEVVGRVNIFNGKLEIVPRREHDIRIVDRDGGGSGQ